MKKTPGKFAVDAMPKFLFEMIRTYLRVEVEGLENLPKRGRALVISNHSGCSGLDAIMLAHSIHKDLGRIPRTLTLWSIFKLLPFLENAAKRMGLKPASAKVGLKLLHKNKMTIIFPEGVRGSYKPSSERYRLQPFRTGFLRLGLLTQSPIIPAIVIGAEESNINFGLLQFGPALKGLALPIPLNMLPLPAKWKIRFLPPIEPEKISNLDPFNREQMSHAADRVRRRMQSIINKELRRRKYIYFKKERALRKSRSA